MSGFGSKKPNRQDRLRTQIMVGSNVKLLRLLYKKSKGKQLSLDYRKTLQDTAEVKHVDLGCSETESAVQNSKPLTFGEIVPESFLKILELCCSSANGTGTDTGPEKVFVDLGSGVGRACLCAALSPFHFTKVWGLELIEDLVKESDSMKETLCKVLNPSFLSSENIKSAPSQKSNSSVSKDTKITDAVFMDICLGLLYKGSNHGHSMKTEAFANSVCHHIGHKAFKSHIKHNHKTFLQFLQRHPEKWELTEGTKSILLLGVDPTITDESISADVKTTATANCGNNSSISSSSTRSSSSSDQCTVNKSTSAVNLTPLDDMSLLSNDQIFNSIEVPLTGSENCEDLDESATLVPWEEQVRGSFERKELQLFVPLPEITFTSASIFEVDWFVQCDVAYAASLLFSDDMMEQLKRQVLLMKTGAWFISLKPLVLNSVAHAARVVLVEESYYKMSWRMAKVYIYRIA